MGTPATEAKKRYNRREYDYITTYINKDGKELVKECAEAWGMTVAEYIRELLIHDAQEQGHSDAVQRIDLGGGVA